MKKLLVTNLTIYLKLTIAVFSIFALFAFSNCKSVPTKKDALDHHVNTDCIKPGMNDLTIRWGDVILNTGEIDGWKMDSHGDVFRFTREELSADTVITKITSIDKARLCGFISQINSEMLKIQALNAPGDISRYVEFFNPETGINFRALWNPKFQTVGSKSFREIYDSLMAIVPEKN